ncbi:hypothetical protein FDI69_gp036 [Rhodococcus phage Trina]|uniref:Uncharacterized protein n=1 Tax=Rhodococcus phage Trina TaxID=2027905 RepID=A0A2D0ZWI9_9CAUD|nr:hypothetical protein FDI69_gp036 [Rhodococcus phage Trina]ASZ74853.1 hypothetical protein SEA_TRINA_36 [Rhodococcus phage Trina]
MRLKKLVDYLILFAILGSVLGMTVYTSTVAWVAASLLLVVFITDLDWIEEYGKQ